MFPRVYMFAGTERCREDHTAQALLGLPLMSGKVKLPAAIEVELHPPQAASRVCPQIHVPPFRFLCLMWC